MAAVPPFNVLRAYQPDKRLIDEGGGLQSVVGTLAAEAAASNLTQIRQQQLEERGFGLQISGSPLLQKLCDVASTVPHHAPPGPDRLIIAEFLKLRSADLPAYSLLVEPLIDQG
jgi:hypothetical protein